MERFTKLSDGCVRDNHRVYHDAEGNPFILEWTPTLSDERTNFQDSAKLAEACTFAGGGWKMPQVNELAGIADYSRYNPAIDTDAFPDAKPNWYWSGTVDASSPAVFAWSVYFYDGLVDGLRQGSSGFVRACRRVSPGQ